VVNRRVDGVLFDEICAMHLGQPVPMRSKPELDIKGLHWLAENAPDYYRALCAAITSTPGRTGIEIKKP
jgi:hypothetical protein